MTNSNDDSAQSPHTGQTYSQSLTNNRLELRRWPYTVTAIDETLDATLIQSRGRHILYHALEENSLLAFVSSGVSMAYGRLAWDAWEELQLGYIHKHAGLFRRCAKRTERLLQCYIDCLRQLRETNGADTETLNVHISTCDNRKREVETRRRQMRRLHATLERVREGNGDNIGGELPPIRFQIAEQLHELLRE
ncbi:MAG: hypothetical protein AAFO77_08385, partial [Pseudomonadota bacterium]